MTWDSGLHVILNDSLEAGLRRITKAALAGAIVLWMLGVAADQKADKEEERERMPAGANQQSPTDSAPPKKVMPRRIIPSEEISADSAVSFPVDI